MRTWSHFPEITRRTAGRFVRLAAVAVLIGAAGAGCAGHRRTHAPPSTDVTTESTRKIEPPPKASGSEIHLPGQNRTLPSEDPRNRPRSGAPEMPVLNTPGGASASRSPAPASAAQSSASTGTPPVAKAEDTPDSRPVGGGPSGDPAARLLPPPVPAGEVRFRVQVFASTNSFSAFSMRDETARTVGEPVYVEQEGGMWKVRLGDCKSLQEAQALRRRVKGLGYDDAFVLEVRGR